MLRIVCGALVAGALLAGCTAPGGDPTPTGPSPTASATVPVTGSPTPSPTPTDPFAGGRPPLTIDPTTPEPTGPETSLTQAQLYAIRNDLGQRGVRVEEMQVLSATEVTWNDGSWGCPETGMAYTQALEDGMRVLVRVDGIDYDYRFGSDDRPRLCLPPGR